MLDLNIQEYIKLIKEEYPLEKIVTNLEEFKNLKVGVIGDTIIDRYTFVDPHGRATKDATLATRYKNREEYGGGILAIANHISNFVESVDLITLLGDHDRKEDFVNNLLNKNIRSKLFTKPESPTVIKERIISTIRNEKLIKIDYMNDVAIPKNLENEISEYLKTRLEHYDLVIVGDFGHGFITEQLVEVIQNYSNYIAANIQTNSANMGFNLVTRYNAIQFLTSNESEIKLALHDRFSDSNTLISKLKKTTNFKNFLLTRGSEGVIYVSKGENYSAPALINSVKDVVGAGDAVFAFSSLCNYKKIEPKILTFLANAVGGIASNIIGNKENITKESLINFITDVYTKV